MRLCIQLMYNTATLCILLWLVLLKDQEDLIPYHVIVTAVKYSAAACGLPGMCLNWCIITVDVEINVA